MKRFIAFAGLALAVAVPLWLSPASASASCADRKTTGTILGGVGGALIGNSISGGGGGAILGGLGGAYLGHEIAGSGCRRAPSRTAYYEPRRNDPGPAPGVYYDQYGNAVAPGASSGPSVSPVIYTDASSSACRTEMRSYYDNRGVLTTTPVKVCSR